MMTFLLFTLAALAEQPLWTAVDLEPVAGVVSVAEGPNGTRASLSTGGIIRVHIAESVAAARDAFEGEHRTAATSWSPASTALPGDQAAGDGRQLLLIRDRNAVVFIRDLQGDALALSERVRAQLGRE